MELGLNLALDIGHIVVLVTLDGVGDSIVDALVVVQGIVGLYLTCLELGYELVGLYSGLLTCHRLHGQVYQIVVSLSLLGWGGK